MSRPATVQPAILSLLEKQHILSALQISAELEKSGHDVNKTTVYRALEKLQESGQVCKQIFGNDQLMYELRTAHHDHLVCESCGKVETTNCVNSTPPKIHGFQVSHHHMTIFGKCRACSQ